MRKKTCTIRELTSLAGLRTQCRKETPGQEKRSELTVKPQEPFLISTFWFLGFNLQFTALFPLYPLPPSQKNPWVEVEVGNRHRAMTLVPCPLLQCARREKEKRKPRKGNESYLRPQRRKDKKERAVRR